MGSILGSLWHKSLIRRAVTASVIAVALWIGSWSLSYLFLSEGSFREVLTIRVPEEALMAGPSLGAAIFQWNVLFGVGAIVIGSLFAIGRLSLGYIAPWWWAIGYGVALGTNSFVLTVPGKLAPNLNVMWQHIGAREILAYLLVAAALVRLDALTRASLGRPPSARERARVRGRRARAPRVDRKRRSGRGQRLPAPLGAPATTRSFPARSRTTRVARPARSMSATTAFA